MDDLRPTREMSSDPGNRRMHRSLDGWDLMRSAMACARNAAACVARPGHARRRRVWQDVSSALMRPIFRASTLSIALALPIGVTTCTRPSPPASAAPAASGRAEVVLDGETMGGTWNVKLIVSPTGDDAARARARDDARALQAPIDAVLERINDAMSTYRPNSEISRFNKHASIEPFPVSKELALVVQKSIEIGRATDGAFDITLDPLINLWGFDRSGRRAQPPTADEIKAARAHVGLDKLRVITDEPAALVKSDPHITINLGGIAAGYAVDVVSAMLDERGLHDYMVEITGEVRARGKNVRNEPWRIGVKKPKDEGDARSVVVKVPLAEQSLTTSGSYHNYFMSGGRRFTHILDPKTGAPVETELVSVTVLYRDALTADAYDTPFIIVGEARAREIIARTPGMEALFIHADEGLQNVRITKTAGFPVLEEDAP